MSRVGDVRAVNADEARGKQSFEITQPHVVQELPAIDKNDLHIVIGARKQDDVSEGREVNAAGGTHRKAPPRRAGGRLIQRTVEGDAKAFWQNRLGDEVDYGMVKGVDGAV